MNQRTVAVVFLFMSIFILPALVLVLPGCHTRPEVEIERRVPVDVVGDCVALRERLCQCPGEAAELILSRRERRDPAQRRRDEDPRQRAAALRDAAAELSREAGLSPQERRSQCQQVAIEAPPPSPGDVAAVHRCLSLPCRQRISCLQPLMLTGPHGAERD